MIEHRPGTRRTILFAFLFIVIPFLNPVHAQGDPTAGGVLFKSVGCNACHAGTMIKDLTGPALYGVQERVPDTKKLHAWIRNTNAVLGTGDPYFTALFLKWNKTPMNSNTSLTDKQIDDILAYIDFEGKKNLAGPGPGDPPVDGKLDESDSSILYGILTLILAVIAMILLGINANLRKLAADKDGERVAEPIPFYRNKTYITLITLLLFVVGGFFMTKGAIKLGRQKNYQPTQPIYYSHKVHAGKNQISCLYCHGGAYEGKQANIPSPNVCMNCHMTINEYTKGPKIFKEDGSEVNGTLEILKLYDAVGWDPQQKKYVKEGTPIKWIRIHSLPDHVYFNHSQHTRAGKVQCQTCHGEVTAMDEVYQFADLSMGWCINCHRETKVDFNNEKGEGNKFYSIYQKFHEEIKAGKRDSVTVSDIGGTECQKCHY